MWFIFLTIIVLFLMKYHIEYTHVPFEVIKTPYDAPVPRIIHQTAPADESKWNPIWKPCQESWKRNFPNWEYKMWTDEDLDEFMKTKYSWFYPIYIAYPRNIMRFDSARYFILYEYGGIYADMDFECVKNFEHVLPVGKAFAAETPWDTLGEVYQNALMGSPAKHEFWNKVFEDLIQHKDIDDVLQSTGPEVIHRVADDNPPLFTALKKQNFAPPSPKELDAPNHDFAALTIKESQELAIKRMKVPPGPNVYTRHHGSCAWCMSN
jgi:mannosyltransferase OCH1-like enzyme